MARRKRDTVRSVERCVWIEALPAGLEGLRLAHISDLHAPKGLAFVAEVNRRLRAARADLVAITGDMVHRPHWISAAARELPPLLAGVKPPLGTFAVLGNHEGSKIAALLESLGVVVLQNQCATLQHGGARFHLAGISFRERAELPRAVGTVAGILDRRRPTIALAHLPSTVFALPDGCVDLLLCGHTHGGQWRFGRLGCLWTNDQLPRDLAFGLNKVGGTYLHVTAGLGESGPIPIRIGCPPEVAVLVLRRAGP